MDEPAGGRGGKLGTCRSLESLVFLDIGMAGLNGYDACARIKEMPWGGDVVIVALTGWGQEKDRLRSRDAGFDGHLVKPASLDAIKTLMDDFRLGRPLKRS